MSSRPRHRRTGRWMIRPTTTTACGRCSVPICAAGRRRRAPGLAGTNSAGGRHAIVSASHRVGLHLPRRRLRERAADGVGSRLVCRARADGRALRGGPRTGPRRPGPSPAVVGRPDLGGQRDRLDAARRPAVQLRAHPARLRADGPPRGSHQAPPGRTLQARGGKLLVSDYGADPRPESRPPPRGSAPSASPARARPRAISGLAGLPPRRPGSTPDGPDVPPAGSWPAFWP